MEKQMLLSRVDSSLSFLTSFFREYRKEITYKNEGELINLINDILQALTTELIPESLYDRVSKLLDTLNIEDLIKQATAHSNLYNFELLKKLCDKIMLNSLFVRKTYGGQGRRVQSKT